MIDVRLDVATELRRTPLKHFWRRVVGAGRANEGLRADWQRQLRFVHEEAGFGYVRFHGLFHDDMFVYRERNGIVDPYFQYIDLLFDAILETGMRPFVELSFSPAELARETGTVFWWRANGSPPTDNEKWAALVRATVEHWVARYGLDEVRQWYFEVWNEPNLEPFFRGTKSEYFELYKVSALAIKSIDSTLRVGGPATSNFVPDARFDGEIENLAEHAVVLTSGDLDALDWRPVWVVDFLAYCADQRLPVDFVSCHPYPTDWALDAHSQGRKLTRGASATPNDLRTLRSLVDGSAYPDAEIHLTEWSSSSSPRDYTHDYNQAATYIVKANLESIGLVDSLAYWTFTDIFEESGAGQEPFHGGFGMLNQHGIPKPSMHAYRMLGALGDEILRKQPGAVVTRDSTTGKLTALIYHYPAEVLLTAPGSFETRDTADRTLSQGHHELLSLRLDGVAANTRFQLEVVDTTHGSAMHEWQQLGAPTNLTNEQVDSLLASTASGLVSDYESSSSGELTVEIMLAPWSIAFLTEH
jgi:xylan 1,4-beta-xylosidase